MVGSVSTSMSGRKGRRGPAYEGGRKETGRERREKKGGGEELKGEIWSAGER